MSSTAAINLLRALNMTLTLTREVGLGYKELGYLIRQAADDNRDVELEDLEGLLANVDGARDRLQQAIDEAKD